MVRSWATSLVRNLGSIIIDGLRLDFLKQAFQQTGEQERLLDLGCGVKPFKPIYDKYVNSSVGIDVNSTPHSQHAIDKVYNGQDIPFNNGEFDIVLSTEVMEHVPEPDLFLREIRRVLRSEGFLILTVPFFTSLHEEPHDYYRYTIHGLRHLLSKAGFEEIRVDVFGEYFCVLINMLTQIQLKFWYKISRAFRLDIIYSVINPFIFLFVYLPQVIYLTLIRYPFISGILKPFQYTPKGYGIIARKK